MAIGCLTTLLQALFCLLQHRLLKVGFLLSVFGQTFPCLFCHFTVLNPLFEFHLLADAHGFFSMLAVLAFFSRPLFFINNIH